MDEANNGHNVPISGLPPGEKACFRFMIPSAWAQQAVGGMKMMQQMGFVPCIKANCSLWNSEKESLPIDSAGECWDVTTARATARIAKLKWDEVVGSEH